MLTDVQCRKAKGAEKPYKLSDSQGLFLYVTTNGYRSWRLKYRTMAGKEKLLTLGSYPEVSLVEARDARDEARKAIRSGRDPALERKQAAVTARTDAENSFEAVARAWHALHIPRWSKHHARNVIDSLEDDLFPEIGKMPIRDVTEALLLSALRKVERRGAIETAHRIRQRASEVFAYAAANGMRTGDPAAVIKTLLKPKPKAAKQPALTTLAEVKEMLWDVDNEEAQPITKLANRFLALTAVRSAVQRGAKWSQMEGLDGDQPLWRIPPSAMKLALRLKDEEAYEHLVPLSRQAVDVLEAIRPLTGAREHIFPNAWRGTLPMSENAVRALIIRANGGKYHRRHCPHGYRSSFSTIMNEWRREHGRPDDREVIDLMLGHVAVDKVEGAYNRASHMERRRELGQIWADMLLEDAMRAKDLLFRLAA